jgi:DNA-binding winged helix-turn-helix (wHTH) protein
LIWFDLFELDVRSSQLRRRGLPVDLAPQGLKVLMTLAERPNELVTRKELKEALWPGQSYGDFDSRLNFVVKKLREALGDDAEQPRYVQTVRKSGYLFIAPVRELQRLSATPPASIDQPDPSQPLMNLGPATPVAGNGFQHRRDRLVLALSMVLLGAITVAGVPMLRQHGPGRQAGSVVPASVVVTNGENLRIFSVSEVIPEPRQRIVIKGTGFGLHVPYARTDSPYLAIRDLTGHWSAGRMIPQNSDDVMVDVESWTDTEIVVSGFSGYYGRNGWKLRAGDELEVAIWNPQSGMGPALYRVRVMASQ